MIGVTAPPWPPCRPTTLSVRWVRNVDFEAGTYRFTSTWTMVWWSASTARRSSDEWHDADNATYVKDVNLTKGVHEVRVRYYEGTDAAKIKLSWAKVQAPSPWTAKYFNNTTLAGDPVLTRGGERHQQGLGQRLTCGRRHRGLFLCRVER